MKGRGFALQVTRIKEPFKVGYGPFHAVPKCNWLTVAGHFFLRFKRQDVQKISSRFQPLSGSVIKIGRRGKIIYVRSYNWECEVSIMEVFYVTVREKLTSLKKLIGLDVERANYISNRLAPFWSWFYIFMRR